MKRALSLALAVVLCLTLCACGKTQAAKDTIQAIEKIGEVSLESIEVIEHAEKMYSILTDNEKEQVDNRLALIEAREKYELLYNNQPSIKLEKALSEGDYIEAQTILDENPEIENFEEIQNRVIYETYLLTAINNLKPYLKDVDALQIREVVFSTSTKDYPIINISYSSRNGYDGRDIEYAAFSGADLSCMGSCSTLDKDELDKYEQFNELIICVSIANTWTKYEHNLYIDIDEVNRLVGEKCKLNINAEAYTAEKLGYPDWSIDFQGNPRKK